MLTAFLASLVVGKAALGQSLVDNSKSAATEDEGKDLLDIQWMLVGHRSTGPSIHMLAISFDGKTMVSGGNLDSTLKIWDIERHVLKRTIVCRGLGTMIYVDVSPDAELVLAGSSVCIKVYRAKTGELLKTLPLSNLVEARFTGYNTLAYRKADSRLNATAVINYMTGEELAVLPDISNVVNIPLSPDRRWLFGHKTKKDQWFNENTNSMWETTIQNIYWMRVNDNSIETYTTVEQADLVDPIVVCLKDNALATLDALTMRMAALPFRKEKYFYSDPLPQAFKISRFVVSSDGGTFMIPVLSSRFHKLECYICDSESLNIYTRLLDVTYADMEFVSRGKSKISFALGPMGLYIYVGDSEYSGGMNVSRPPVIELWGDNGKRMQGFLDNGSSVCDLKLSDDGKVFAISTTEGRVKLFERSSGAFLQFIDCPPVFWEGQMIPAPMQDLVVGKDFIAGASPGPHVFVRAQGKKDIKAKHLIDPDTGWSDTPVMCGYEEGKKILVATPLSKLGLRLMETVSGKVLRTYEPKVPLTRVERAGDYVVGINGPKLYVWNIETGELANQIENDFVKFSALAFSKKRIYAGAEDGTITSYDLLTGKTSKLFKGHESPIVAMAISPDGRTLISRSNDAGEEFPLRTWDVESAKMLHKYGEEIGPMEPIFRSGNSIRFTPDGKYFLFGRGDGSVVYVKLDTSAPKEEPKEIEKP